MNIDTAWIFFFCVSFALITADIFFSSRACHVLIISFVLFVVFGGTYCNGADWMNYIHVFDLIADATWSELVLSPPMEIGYSVLNKLISSTGLDYWFAVGMVAIFNIAILMFVSVRTGARNLPILFACIFFVEGWSLYQEHIRQSIAVSLCVLAAFEFLRARKIFGCLIVLAATGFHISAVFGFVYLYIANRIVHSKGAPLSWRDISLFGAIFGAVFFLIIVALHYRFVDAVVPQYLLSKIGFYMEDDSGSQPLLNVGLIQYVAGFLVLLPFYRRAVSRKHSWLSFVCSMGILWCLFGPVFRVAAILTRFEHYFLVLIPFVTVTYGSRYASGQYGFMVARNFLLVVFLFSFMIRILLQPAQGIWVTNYQNGFLSMLFGGELEDETHRMLRVCNHLRENGVAFCDSF